MQLNRRSLLAWTALGSSALAAGVRFSISPAVAQPNTGAAAELHADGTLPGSDRLYLVRAGKGEHHLVGGQIATVIARSQDTGALYESAILTGGQGATMPVHVHENTQEAFYVMDGELEFNMDGRRVLMSRGDYAYVPAGTPHGHVMRSWRTQVLTWTIGEKVSPAYAALGEPFPRSVQPEDVENEIDEEKLLAAEMACDIRFTGADLEGGLEPEPVRGTLPPDQVEPYFVRKGEGERLVAADQTFSFYQTQASSTDGSFITVVAEGPAGQAIPEHYHEHHSEIFFCLDGVMTMWANGQELQLHPGDFLQVTPSTVHSYRFDSPYTKMIGWLTPGIFERFFRLVGDPYEGHVFPLDPPPFRFDRVLAHLDEIDLHVVQQPQ